MANLASVLGVPEIAAYQQAQDHGMRQQAAQMQQVGALQGIIAKARAQQQEQQFRAEIAGARTPEEQLAVAAKYMGPDALGRMVQGSQDRAATRDATKESTMARLNQTWQIEQQRHEIAVRNAATGEARAAEVQRHNRTREAMDAYAQRVTGERLFYDTGARVQPLGVLGAPPSAPAGQPVAFNVEGMQGSAPDEASALAIARRLQGQPVAMPSPAGAPTAPMPTAAAPDASVPMPAAPNNMDARDLRLQGMPQPAAAPTAAAPPTAAPAVPAPAELPEWIKQIKSPKERTAMEGKWRLQQEKSNTTPAGDYSKRGEDYIATLSPQDQALVRKVIAYEIDPKSLSVLGGRRERVLSMAAQADPKFDQKEYNTQYNAINRFATGPQGNAVRSLNVAIEHMDTARKLGTALQNNDVRAFNEVANLWARETGSTRPTNFEAVKDILANEVVKGIIGGQSALQDREEMASKIKTSSSPQQLMGVLNTWTELLGGQLVGLERQYSGATGRTSEDFRSRYVTPRALSAIQSVQGGTATPGGAWDESKERRYQELLRRRSGTQ